MPRTNIDLTAMESALFTELRTLRDDAGLGGRVVMRVAGGWVRDKLLGVTSKDIDIALSDMTGGEFTRRIGIGGHTIEANPEKSKHLETIKALIAGQEVDFVNLRAEDYADSRIPSMRMGTAAEDARRRDLTINALFYNLDTGLVEDFVGGLADLEQGILRTPLDPLRTFLDDPLRMLRVLRFHARFPQSQIDPQVTAALHHPQAQQAFRHKVSKERSGPEILGMLAGDAPASAVRLFLETGLYQNVFAVPGMAATLGIRQDQKCEHHCLDLLDHTVEVVRNTNQLMLARDEPKKLRSLMNLAALFHDFGKMHPDGRQNHPHKPGQMQYAGHEEVSARLADESLKAVGIGSDEREFVIKMVAMHMRPHRHAAGGGWTSRAIGKFLRDTAIPGQESLENLWEYVFLHAIADSMSKGDDSWHEDVTGKRQAMEEFRNFIAHRKSQPADLVKPLLNGHEIMTLVPELSPGSGFIRDVTAMLLDLQDAGDITNKDQARARVLAWKLAHHPQA